MGPPIVCRGFQQKCKLRFLLNHIASVTSDVNISFDTIFFIYIHYVALLTSSPVMWREEHLRNFSVLQIVHVSNLVKFCVP